MIDRTQVTVVGLALLQLAFAPSTLVAQGLSPVEQLGRALFFDETLSVRQNQSCSSCHDPSQGFSSPDFAANASGGVIEGSVSGRFGNRKPPTAAYNNYLPVLHHQFEGGDILFVGGAFVDGRATGRELGTALADQAMGPFTNPVEMAMPHAACVVRRVCDNGAAGEYPVTLEDVWGAGICTFTLPAEVATQCADPDAKILIADEQAEAAIQAGFAAIAHSIAAYESSVEVNRFSSRFDRWQAGQGELSQQELAGFDLFTGKAQCVECHVMDAGQQGGRALFTDFTYDNLGVPRNPDNPWYDQAAFNPDGTGWIDPGLAGFLVTDKVYDVLAPGQAGKQRVPTLRNLDARIDADSPKAFMHNGYFKTLAGVVRFYNKRDVWPRCDGNLVREVDALALECWPAPEVAATVNTAELGNLKLTEAEEASLVAFLRTLTDE